MNDRAVMGTLVGFVAGVALMLFMDSMRLAEHLARSIWGLP